MRHLFVILSTALVLIGCDSNLTSSVPAKPVQINVNTDQFPLLNPGNITSYFYVDKDGHHYANGEVFKEISIESGLYRGHGGVVVVNGLDGRYAAYDRCCPHCLNPQQPVRMDSYARAICPTCGEEYDTMNSYGSGSGFPTKGISKEGLRRYSVQYANHTIYVSN